MKVIIITSAFYESTFPLVKELRKKYEVTLYSVFSKQFLTPPAFSIKLHYNEEQGLLSSKEALTLIPTEVKNYFNNDIEFIKIIITSYQNTRSVLKDLGEQIQKQNPDIIHLIGINRNIGHLLPFFKNFPVIFLLHEVDSTRGLPKKLSLKIWIQKILLKKLQQRIYKRPNTKYITFSNNEYKKLLQIESVKKQDCKVIQFGIFDIFKNYNKLPEDFTISQKPYFLFYGLLKKYKGIDIFFNLAKLLEKENIQFVAAGKDVEGFIRKQKYIPSNLIVISKYLEDHEISYLVKNSLALIMPYRSASQSGIPPTAFAFNKPVVAFDVPGINEYLKHNHNSYLTDYMSTTALLKAIKLLLNKTNYERLSDNIKEDPFANKNINWNIIAENIINVYQELK